MRSLLAFIPKRVQFAFALFVVLSGTADAVHSESIYGPDTTRIRKTEIVRKSTGEVVADIPGEILKTPVYLAEFTTKQLFFSPPIRMVCGLIDLGAEARPYIPIVGYSSTAGFKFGIGLRKLANIAPTDFLKAKWYYSTHHYQSYLLESRFEDLFTGWLGLELQFSYRKRPRERFYGIGMGSRKDQLANYTLEDTQFRMEIPIHTPERFYFSLLSGYRAANLSDGKDPDLPGSLDSISSQPEYEIADGRLDNTRYAFFGASLEWDGRDNRGQPSRGLHAYGSLVRYAGVARSDGRDFSRFTVDVRHYLNLWHKRILAARFYLQDMDAQDESRLATPIYFASTLGGQETLRGYANHRFVDNDLAMVTLEYRYPIYDRVDAFLFLDQGRVYADLMEERFLEDWKYSAGFGLRLWNPRTLIGTVEIARSDESTQIYFELGAAW